VPTGCFISSGRSLDQAIERVRLVESLGHHSAFVTHVAGRESLSVVTAYALATERIRVGTGVVPIYTRTPATMAQTSATIDELSDRRLTLGLGVSHRVVVEGWHGQTIDRPVAEMREYVEIVRAILRGEDPPAGGKWRTAFRLAGIPTRPDLPIFIAALSPAMLRLIGDGVMLWLCNPSYIRDVVVPAVRESRERAGYTLTGFEVVAAVPAALTDDPGSAYDAIRGELLTNFSLPFYRTMLEGSGYADDIAAFDAAQGDVDAMRTAISDRFLSSLTAVGDERAVRTGVDRYVEAVVTLPWIGPISRTDFEGTVGAAAPDWRELRSGRRGRRPVRCGGGRRRGAREQQRDDIGDHHSDDDQRLDVGARFRAEDCGDQHRRQRQSEHGDDRRAHPHGHAGLERKAGEVRGQYPGRRSQEQGREGGAAAIAPKRQAVAHGLEQDKPEERRDRPRRCLADQSG
jgi:alkanesulfonate monooxygenase SsuD/methylene tetrahydromethanopterin reductase-like flavin-dependent oxidoreductase (luciferase family)